MTEVIDLDALAPEPVVIKLNGKEFTIKPPSVEDIMRLSATASKLEKADTMDQQELEALIGKLIELLKTVAPDIADEKYTTIQLIKLVNIITEMATPPDIKELEKKGIKVGADSGPKDQPDSPTS